MLSAVCAAAQVSVRSLGGQVVTWWSGGHLVGRWAGGQAGRLDRVSSTPVVNNLTRQFSDDRKPRADPIYVYTRPEFIFSIFWFIMRV